MIPQLTKPSVDWTRSSFHRILLLCIIPTLICSEPILHSALDALSGLEPLDVNGLAASIELYFGEDVLCAEQNKLTPVQWKGYNSTLRQYQALRG